MTKNSKVGERRTFDIKAVCPFVILFEKIVPVESKTEVTALTFLLWQQSSDPGSTTSAIPARSIQQTQS